MKHIPFISSINNDVTFLNIKQLEITPMVLRFLKECNTIEDIIKELDNILKDFDTSVILNCGKILSSNTYQYDNILSKYYYYLEKLYNFTGLEPIKLHNEYLEKLIEQHCKNIVFDYNYKEPINLNKSNKKQVKLPQWIKQKSKDLFKDEILYIYQNTKTGEIIKSSNPNLIEEGKLKHHKSVTSLVKAKPKAKEFTGKVWLKI